MKSGMKNGMKSLVNKRLQGQLAVLLATAILASVAHSELSPASAVPTTNTAPKTNTAPTTDTAPTTSAAPKANPVAPREHRAYTAIYQAAYKGLPLQATHRLERAGSDWFFSSIASGFFGQIEENATFTYTDSGIVPKHYTYLRSVLGHDKENELLYNPDDKLVVSSNTEKTWKLPLTGGELDQGTYALALRDDVARGLQEMCYKVVEEKEVDRYCFRVTGKETIDTALGKLDTVVVERVRKAQSPRRTRFWLAPSLDYSIARLEHREKEQTAYSLEITYFREESGKKSSKP